MKQEKLQSELKALIEYFVQHHMDENFDPIYHVNNYFIQQNEGLVPLLLDEMLKSVQISHREMEQRELACFAIFDVILQNLHYAADRQEHWALEYSAMIQEEIAERIGRFSGHTVSLLLSAIYHSHLPILPVLQEAFSENSEQILSHDTDVDLANLGMNDLFDKLDELALNLSPFELAEMLVEQSQIVPHESQMELISHLFFTTDKLREVFVLLILHPNNEIREEILKFLQQGVNPALISSVSLRRMITVRNWLPENERPILDQIIKKIRKANIECAPFEKQQIIKIVASQFDGSGVQLIFIISKQGKSYSTSGFLLKRNVGIQESWSVIGISKEEVDEIFEKMQSRGGHDFDFRLVDIPYLNKLVPHFIAEGLDFDHIPDIKFLEIVELIGVADWRAGKMHPRKLVEKFLNEDGTPALTEDEIKKSLQRSKRWFSNKNFTESWFDCGEEIDNQLRELVANGTIVIEQVINDIIEPRRENWAFLFLCMALWAKAKVKSREKLWFDLLILAKLLYDKKSLLEIPIMFDIAFETCLASDVIEVKQ